MSQSLDSENTQAQLKRALWCGILPLVAGGLTTLVWQFREYELLIGAGILVIVVGCLLFLLGAFSLWQYQKCARQQAEIPRKRILRNTSLTACLLLVNFPAAGACLFLALGTASHYVVVIQNDSSQTLSQIEIVSGSETIRMDPIKPGGRDSCDFRDIVEWDLILNAKHGDVIVEEELDGYTMRIRTKNRVTLLADGSFEIRRTSNGF